MSDEVEVKTEEPKYKVEFIDAIETPLNVNEAIVQDVAANEAAAEGTIADEIELDENAVYSYLGRKLNKEVKSLEDLYTEKVVEKELPEDVNAFYKYKKDTGRGLDDFIKLNQDYDAVDNNTLLKEYYKATKEGLDEDDIETMLNEFTFDEDIDEDSEIAKRKLSQKMAVNEAKKYFNQQKETYKVPLESSLASLSEDDKVQFAEYKQHTEQSKQDQEKMQKKNEVFTEKTKEIFSENFKGFEFKINDEKTLILSPADAKELMQTNSTPMNLIGKFLDENGVIKDAAGYHKALATANYADKLIKAAYEQGVSDATEDVVKGQKNINMSERKASAVIPKAGLKVEFVNSFNNEPFKISLPKNKT